MSFIARSTSSLHGGPLSDSTNGSTKPAKLKQRNGSKASCPTFPLTSSTMRKSLPTCTLSLAFASASSSGSSNSASDTHNVTLIPFPSSIPFPVDSPSPISEPDVDEMSASVSRPQSPLVGWQRRRSNACLSQTSKSRSSSPCSRPRSTSSSSRKRAKKVTKRLNADIQFLSLLQRSVAWRLAERGLGVPDTEVGDISMGPGFEVQDITLVSRLRSYLISQGCGPGSLEFGLDEVTGSFEMDVDITVDLLPSSKAKVAPMSALVASLILRHRERSALRARPASPVDALGRSSVSRVASPLALCVGGEFE